MHGVCPEEMVKLSGLVVVELTGADCIHVLSPTVSYILFSVGDTQGAL